MEDPGDKISYSSHLETRSKMGHANGTSPKVDFLLESLIATPHGSRRTSSHRLIKYVFLETQYARAADPAMGVVAHRHHMNGKYGNQPGK